MTFDPLSAVVPEGLVAYWGFDADCIDANYAYDLSGNGHTGTLSGTTKPSAVAGKIGGALRFNHLTSYVSAPISIGTIATFCCWATCTSLSPTPMLFALKVGSPGPDLFFTNGRICWNTYDGYANPFGNIPVSATNGNSHHYCVVVSPGLTALYYDEVLLGTAVYKNPTTNLVQIGGQLGGYIWGGDIDDFRIYNRVISQAEVTQIYQAGLDGVRTRTPQRAMHHLRRLAQ